MKESIATASDTGLLILHKTADGHSNQAETK